MQKKFSEFIAAFLKSTSNFDFFEKKKKNDLMYFQNYQLTKTWLHKCLKGSILEHRLTLNMLKGQNTTKIRKRALLSYTFINQWEAT